MLPVSRDANHLAGYGCVNCNRLLHLDVPAERCTERDGLEPEIRVGAHVHEIQFRVAADILPVAHIARPVLCRKRAAFVFALIRANSNVEADVAICLCMLVRNRASADDANLQSMNPRGNYNGVFMLNRSGWVVVASLALISCARTPSADVAATVNNRPITYSELDRTIKTGLAPGATTSNDDQMQLQRLDVLRTMIDNEIMLQRAEKMSLMATDSEVDTKLNEIRTPFTKEEFDKQLKNRGITLEELRVQLRRDLSLQKLINKEITSKINISDQDVTTFYTQNKNSFNFHEPRIRLAQIAVTTVPTAVSNMQNNKAQNEQQAVQKIQAIEARLKQGEDFSVLAQNYSEDAGTRAVGRRSGLSAGIAIRQDARFKEAATVDEPRRILEDHPQRRWVSHLEDDFEGARGSARTQRPSRAAADSNRSAESQRSTVEAGVW